MCIGNKVDGVSIWVVRSQIICIGFVEVICKVIKLKLNLDLDGEGG